MNLTSIETDGFDSITVSNCVITTVYLFFHAMNDANAATNLACAIYTTVRERKGLTLCQLILTLKREMRNEKMDPNSIARQVFIILGNNKRALQCPGLEVDFPYAKLMVECITDTEQAFHELPQRAFVHVLESLMHWSAISTPQDKAYLLNHIQDLTFHNAELAMVCLPEIWKTLDLKKAVKDWVEGRMCANAAPNAKLDIAWTITRQFLCSSKMQHWQNIGKFFAAVDEYLGEDAHKLGNLFGYSVHQWSVCDCLPKWSLAITMWKQIRSRLRRAYFMDWLEDWEMHNDRHGKCAYIVYEDGDMHAPRPLLESWAAMSSGSRKPST